MSQKKYWQSFGELNNTKAYVENAENEFKEELPFELNGSENKTPRRDFLKYLGFSTAAATLAASCEMPVKKSIPFLNKPADIVPGVANYYATTFVLDGDVVPVLAKVRDGRPIKIEGNELGFAKGATTQRVQASVLSLYDTARVRFPMEKAADGFKEAPTYEAVDKKIAAALANAGSKQIVLLSSTLNSPTVQSVMDEFKAKYPSFKHVTYDAVSYSGILQANEASYGKRAIPSYQFDQAKVIVSFGADFLGSWISPVEYAKQYAAGRKIDDKNLNMSRHFQFESMFSMTGANADERFTHKPSELGAVLLNLYAKLGGAVSAPAIADKRLAAGIESAAKELLAAAGNAVVVCGSNDVNAQVVVNAINDKIGASGKTINFGTTVNYRKGIDTEFEQFVADMNAGQVGAVLVYGANPVYTYRNGQTKEFKQAFEKIGLTVSFSENEDETSSLCQYILPAHHYLESWGDAEAKEGYVSFIQPTIHPLFKTRAFATSLLKWSGSTVADYETYFKNYWISKLGSQAAFDKALQDGVIEPATPAVAGAAFNGAALAGAVAKLSEAKKGGKNELVIYQKVSIGDGKMANNPWLQEMPDPITRACWDNYAIISVKTAEELGYKADDEYEVNPPKPVLSIKAGGKEVKLPLLIIPGMNAETVAIAVGYGRSEKIGLAAKGSGQNIYPFVGFNGQTNEYMVADVTIEKTGENYPVAQMQTHNTYGSREEPEANRVEVIREASLATLKKEPKYFYNERVKELGNYGGPEGLEKEGTLYPVFDKPGIKWGMSIDMNSCTGCGACVVACSAENNVSVVGKNQVAKYHDMHWLRIDRYFSGDVENPDVVFQPMLCQHCDNAPCENVCPVAATNHSSEGLNQMTYNRCIGTRYCANNCPYKVRRFNWHDWNGADSFKDNQMPIIESGRLNEVTIQMNDDLTRMVLNPDVTVRSRGVIEKCSFCVQRLQEAKLTAKKESRPMVDNDIKTACQQACATNAIVFGNVNDKESAISKVRKQEEVNRTYYVLEQIHVLPNVSYMAKVRNTERIVGNVEEGHEESHEEKKEATEAAAH
ncbi:MAG: TAT-variant-translocated molybdopterin oxidoreductase [Lacibacter sp.]